MKLTYGTGQYSPSAASNESHTLVTPYNYRADGTKRLLVWCHSAGGLSQECVVAADNALMIVEALVSTLGLPLVAFDGMPPSGGQAQHWGNDTAQARLSDAISYAQAQVGAKVDRVVLCAVSMGGTLALNWARANPSKVAGLALMYPAVSLQGVHDGTGGAASAAASVEAAYGGSLASYQAALPTHDPAENESAYASIGPAKMWYSTADATVGTANQTGFAAAVGSGFQTAPLGAVGHADMTKIDPLDMLKFVQGCV